MKVSAIIPACENTPQLRTLIDKLFQQTSPLPTEIIILDSSPEHTLQVYKGPVTKVIPIHPEAFDHGGTRRIGAEMLMTETIDKLKGMCLSGMAEALREQTESSQYRGLPFEERLGFLVEKEWLARDERRFTRRLRDAKLRQSATIEEIDFHVQRHLDRSTVMGLANCEWILRNHNLIITGPTGVGKTYLACAIGHRACKLGYSAGYWRLGRLLFQLGLSKGDGSYVNLIKKLGKAQLLILDDWGLAPLDQAEALELLEVIEDRSGRGSAIVVSQVPVDMWHQQIGNGTVAYAILDRLVHNAYRIEINGESMRKERGKVSSER